MCYPANMVSRIDSRTEADHRGAEALLYFVSNVHLSNDNSRAQSPSESPYDAENDRDANSSGDECQFTLDSQERSHKDSLAYKNDTATFSNSQAQTDAKTATHARSRTPHPFSVGKLGDNEENHTGERPLWSASLPSFGSGTRMRSSTLDVPPTGRASDVTEVLVNLSENLPSALNDLATGSEMPVHDDFSDGTESHTTSPLYQDIERDSEGDGEIGVSNIKSQPLHAEAALQENEHSHVFTNAREHLVHNRDNVACSKFPQDASTRLSISNTNTDERFGALNLSVEAGSFSEDDNTGFSGDSRLQARRSLYEDVNVSESIDELGIIQQFAQRRNGERNRRTSASAVQRGQERAKLKQGGRWARSQSQGTYALQNGHVNVHSHTQQQQPPMHVSRSPSPLTIQSSRGSGSMQGIAPHPYRPSIAENTHENINSKIQRRQMHPGGVQRRYSVDSSGLYNLDSKQQRMSSNCSIQRTHTAGSTTTSSPTFGHLSETPPERPRSSLSHNRPIHTQTQAHAQVRTQAQGVGMHTQTQQSCMGMMPSTGGTTTYGPSGASPSPHQRTTPHGSVATSKRGNSSKTPYAKARGSLGWSVLGVSDFRAKDQKRTNRRVGAKGKTNSSTSVNIRRTASAGVTEKDMLANGTA
ncbi:hypothetical protein SARC_12721 [Sphaeroforma arctica JP610]|uniref:Uncharacterized protein n=1 Tax=Sphaeroforma arctica JP610 TaxID=667725 RepID=A0A0L0FDC3_9EUKA|nr:hypothetical protein SARC_12721 [Sphaeroforma arctica JP610]KNC74740.1 hypothetical protein SARC_12721 [Sphaeroforma arctica JP610]|eukprot:XP_014148642.1 hypothetical protein SARC_12721 [Sphaeroforma arctica JP610]